MYSCFWVHVHVGITHSVFCKERLGPLSPMEEEVKEELVKVSTLSLSLGYYHGHVLFGLCCADFYYSYSWHVYPWHTCAYFLYLSRCVFVLTAVHTAKNQMPGLVQAYNDG